MTRLITTLPCLNRTLFAASFRTWTVTILLLLGAGSTHAALIAYESFNYTTGASLTNQSGGTGWPAAWVANGTLGAGATNLATSLSYTDGLGNVLQTSGGSTLLSGNSTANTSATPYRDLPTTRGTNDGTTTWISFLGLRTGPVTNSVAPFYQRVAALQLREAGTERLSIGRATANSENSGLLPKDTWGIYFGGNGTNTQPSTVSLSNTPASLLLMRIDHVSGNDNIYLFVNPPLNAEPAIGTAQVSTNGNPNFNRIQLFAGNTTAAGIFAQLQVDEIRIGETFADVTPYTPAGGTPPGLTVNLTNKLAELCGSASFFLNATGTAPLSYEWFFNNNPTGGNSNSLVLNNLSAANAGNYFVIVTNASGSVTSTVVSLTLQDNTPPTISQCATNQTLISNGSCQAQIPSLTNQIIATDCSGIASITQSPVAGTLVGVGATVVTLSVTDLSNNVATCQATITVTGNGAPTIVSCAPNQFLNADTNQQASIPNLASLVVATNPCGSVTVTQSPLAGTIVGPGVTVVTLTAVTGAGTTNCSATVSVNARPVAANQSVSIAQNTATNLTLGGSDADAGPLTFLITSNPANGALGTLNSNLVTYTPNIGFAGLDSFTFAVSDGAVTSAVATVSIAVNGADIVYPPGPTITKDGTTILLENYANAPHSSRTLTTYPPALNRNDQLSRINFMRAEPTNAPGFGSRFFVCDLNRNLYIVPKANPLATNTWIAYLNLEQIFPRFDNDPGFAGGQTTFAFDPEYATNGIFYTVHMETTAATLAPTNGAYPALDLTGYTTTTAINPPSGTVGRIAVLIEWRDTNVTNTTFEGTAREVMRLGFFGTIHPMGDLLYNPLATPGHPDYRNLYIAVGDGRSGETAGTTHNHPQQLNTLVGKVLRLTPDLNLRLTDELSSNGRYRIPTNGVDPNPFVFTNSYFTNVVGVRHEIYAYGFRNCHRMSWDAVSGKLILTDIGLNSWEEVNIVHKGTNYGWAEREGPEQMLVSGSPAGVTGSRQTVPIAFPASDFLSVTGIAPAIKPTYPVAAYSSRDGDAISSGFVYRGTLMPQLYGKYIFGDITTARLFYCDYNEMLAADDGIRTTMATIREIQIAFNSPYDAPDQGVTNRRLFDIVSEAYKQKGGTNSQALPGGASVTAGLDPYGVAYGAGRADIRLAVGDDNEIYIISKSDASIRKLTAALGPPTITAIMSSGGNVTLTFQSFPGRNYRVQYKNALSDPGWNNLLGDVSATTFSASKTTALTGDMRFFRVQLLP